MIRLFQLLIITILALFISTSVGAYTWECSNIKGVSLIYKEGNFVQEEDNFSGLIIEITKNKGDSFWKIEWKSEINRFTHKGVPVQLNAQKTWVTFVTAHDDVLRTYAFHFRDPVLFFNEMQIQILTLLPQSRLYMAKCRQIN